MNKELFDRGLEIRKKVLGAEFVEKSLATADEFNMPMQELTTEYCWGAVWGRDGLPHKTRSMLNLAMISAPQSPVKLKMHVKGALKNGVTKDEIREVCVPASGDLCRHPGRSLTRSALRAKPSPNWKRAPDTTNARRGEQAHEPLPDADRRRMG